MASENAFETPPPIHKLPSDVLFEIFTACHLCDFDDGPEPPLCPLSLIEFPAHQLLLTHICKRWRDEAIASLDTPLFHGSGDSSEFCPIYLNAVLKALLEKHDTWKTVELQLRDYPPTLDDVPYGHFPNLESVYVYKDNFEWKAEQRHIRRLLRLLTLPANITTSWKNLRLIVIRNTYLMNSDTILEIFKSCPELEQFHFDGFLEPTQRHPTPIPLIHLRKLFLCLYSWSAEDNEVELMYKWFMDLISAPRLTWFEMRLGKAEEEDGCIYPPGPFVDFVKRGRCRLEHFMLDSIIEDRYVEYPARASEWLKLALEG
ncbi:hypothetical protein BDQ17DRAFT_1425777 [Cyathus striatus]|nr:hypothetical protein BDQ17DRAFT_1425777 [Cyathus striatus]